MRVGTTCKCVEGYYMLRTDTAVTCEKCDDRCLECEKNSYDCNACDPEEFRELNSDRNCACIANYVEVLGNCVDRNCERVTAHCQECAYDPDTQQVECVGCAGRRVLSNGECKCEQGYFEEDEKCVKCGSGCQLCVDGDSCSVCSRGSMNNGDGTCSCPISQLLSEVAGFLFCENCISKCSSC